MVYAFFSFLRQFNKISFESWHLWQIHKTGKSWFKMFLLFDNLFAYLYTFRGDYFIKLSTEFIFDKIINQIQ